MTTQSRANNSETEPQGFPLYGGVDEHGRKWRRHYVDFTTPGRDPRTYRMFLVEPEVRVFDDPPSVDVSPWAVALEVPALAKPGDRLHGTILPARFDVQPHGDGPHMSFVVSYIRPAHDTDPTPAHIGIERIEVGRVGRVTDAGRAIFRHRAETEGLPPEAWRDFGRVEVSSSDLKRVPMVPMLDKALEMVRVFARVDKTYKRPGKPADGRWPNLDGGSFSATVIGFAHDANTPPVARGRRKRGATRTGDHGHSFPWHHPSVLAIAAECKQQHMTKADTVAHFRAEHGQTWSEHSVKKMWERCRQVGLLPPTERGTP